VSILALLAEYGYLAVFIGAFLEGETILLLAGLAAHEGHLSLPLVLGIAFVAGAAGDQAFFWAGRAWGPLISRRFPSFGEKTHRVRELMHRFDAALIVGIRFMYGLRIAGPVAMGAMGVKPLRFAVFNLIGAAIWAPVVGGLGYVFAHAIEAAMGDLARYENALLGALAIAILSIVLVKRLAARPRRRRWWSRELP
jgi:membrane protein DedA with SNARE-associated domain